MHGCCLMGHQNDRILQASWISASVRGILDGYCHPTTQKRGLHCHSEVIAENCLILQGLKSGCLSSISFVQVR